MAKIYAVSMNKGGVGKTSLITNLAAAVVRNDPASRVLIIDTDGQSNAALAFGINPMKFEDTMYDVMMGDKTIEDVRVPLDQRLDLAPSNDDLNFLELDVLTDSERFPSPFSLLRQAIVDVRDQYTHIFIDTPPSVGLIAGNVLNVADRVIIPFTPETFAVRGLTRVVQAVGEFRDKSNPTLEIVGVVGMMVDQRTTLHSEMLQQARQYCAKNGIRMFDTVVPRSIRFASATAYEGKPAVWTDRANPIVGAYYELLEEMIEVGTEKQKPR